MSGIAGIWHFDGAPDAGRRVRTILAALAPYGDGSAAEWIDADVALGVCPRSLLPEDRFDRQPLFTPDRRIRLVADIRIDNRAELAARLDLTGGTVAVLSDADLLLAAWERWGERCLDRVVGDYAFAVWDGRERCLFLARDPIGARPLYYCHRPGAWIAFASMPKGLLALPEVSRELDEEQIACQLVLLPTDRGRVMFRDVVRIPPAHRVSVSDRGLQVRRYWSPETSPEVRLANDDEYLEAFRERMDQAVESRCRSLGGIGSHLSAGLDSGTVAATAARILAGAGAGLTAFTAVPHREAIATGSEQLGDEGPAAAEVASRYPNIQHVLVDGADAGFFESIDRFSAAADAPPLTANNLLWISAVLHEARARGLAVLLTGGAGNLTISQPGLGVLAQWFRRGQWIRLIQVARRLHGGGDVSWTGLAFAAVRPMVPGWLGRTLVSRRRGTYPSLVHPETARRLHQQRRDTEHTASLVDPRTAAARTLERMDPGSLVLANQAQYGIDERDPTADRRVIEFCFGVPSEQLLKEGQTRSLVRRAMRTRLPETTLERRRRGVQSADWHFRLGRIRQDLLREIDRQEQSPIAARCLDLPRARALVQQWPTGGFETADTRALWKHALPRGLAMGRFIRQHDPHAPRSDPGD